VEEEIAPVSSQQACMRIRREPASNASHDYAACFHWRLSMDERQIAADLSGVDRQADALRDRFSYLLGFTLLPEPLQQPAAGTKVGRRQTYREDLAPLENQCSYSALEARGL
jgi:hypothetical protein